jgi:hypothetical protein
MKDADYEIYMVVDASGGTSLEAHKYAVDHYAMDRYAMDRMVRPVPCR